MERIVKYSQYYFAQKIDIIKVVCLFIPDVDVTASVAVGLVLGPETIHMKRKIKNLVLHYRLVILII